MKKKLTDKKIFAIMIGVVIIATIIYLYVPSDKDKNTFSIAIKEVTTTVSNGGNYADNLISLIRQKYGYEVGLNNMGDFGDCIWLCKDATHCSSTSVWICDKNSSSFEEVEASYKISLLPVETYNGKDYRASEGILIWYSPSLPVTFMFSKNILTEVEESY